MWSGKGVNSDATTTPCDLIIATPTLLLGTHNPKGFGLVNKVLGIILGWDPLHGLRLAKIKEKNQRSRIARPVGELTQSSPTLSTGEH